jgi:hypothetical protein
MYYSQAQEHADHVFGAQYDDVRERYASELADLKMDDLMYQDEMEYRQKVHEAGFDSAEEYEAYWTHLLKTAEEEHYND